MVTASRKKFRMLVPNLRRASSAASSALCTSCRRAAASLRNLESMFSASLTMSAGRDSGAGSEGTALVESDVVLVVGGAVLGSVWTRESARVWLIRSVKPLLASVLAADSS